MKATFTLIILVVFFIFPITSFGLTTTLRPILDGSEDSSSWQNTGGTTCNGTSCYTEVDESSGGSCSNSDGDTTYIFSNTSGSAQTFDLSLSGIPDGSTITQIDVTSCAVRTQGGAQLQTRWCINGSCSSSGTNIPLGTSYSEDTQSYTGLSITKSGSTDLEIGALNNSSKGIRVSQLYALITYTEPVVSDTTAPSAVSDLALSGATQTSINVAWTAPGDDANVGKATTYDLRYSTAVINDGNFSSATGVSGEPTPSVAGSSESMTVSGLTANTTYYFALKTIDEAGNTSLISNLPSLTTSATPDTSAPSAVSDLATGSITATTVSLSWTAPGDDANVGTATTYDLRYSTSVITSLNFDSATTVSGEPAPSVSGTSETFTVTGLSASTKYYFALKTSDESGNVSDISNLPSGTTIAEETPSNVYIPEGGGDAARSIIISGFAFPNSTIEAFQRNENEVGFKNVPLKEVTINKDGSFRVSFVGLTSGKYFIALRIKDPKGRDTGLLSVAVDFTFSGDHFTLEDFISPPTLGFSETTTFVKGSLEVEGYAIPKAPVTVIVGNKLKYETVATETGQWSLKKLTGLPDGSYNVSAYQTLPDKSASSSLSIGKTFKVSNVLYPEADLNSDNKVNITDWSLFLFRWGSKDSKIKNLIDLNKDGKVDVGDFSIFLRAMQI